MTSRLPPTPKGRLLLAYHFFAAPDGTESVHVIGVYNDESLAWAAIDRLRPLEGFIRYPDGFSVVPCVLNELRSSGIINWTES